MHERVPASAPGCALALPPARAYGQTSADLDLDFGRPDRIALVTAVLAQCSESGDEPAAARQDAAWNLPLGRRIARLLQVVELSSGNDTLPLTLRCHDRGCGQPFEIALSLAQLLPAAPATPPGADIIQFPSGSNAPPLSLRLPTGRDQAAWQKHSYATAGEAMAAIVHSLVTTPPAALIAAEQIASLALAMEEADPLVAFHVATQCPNCSCSLDLPVDLEQLALQKLAGLRRTLLREIHALAIRYGWSEDRILALSPARRAEYLRLIAEAEETLP